MGEPGFRGNLKLPRLTFGCGYFGVGGWSEGDGKKISCLIQRCLDWGVNSFDTAESYGDGVSEEILGRALRRQRQRAIITTKASVNPDPRFIGNLLPFHLKNSLEKSLKRLKTDYVDLYLLHHFNPQSPIEQTLEALSALVREGKIRAWGVSGFSARQLGSILNRECSAYQGEFNLTVSSAQVELGSLCQNQQWAFMAHSPLANGILVKEKPLHGRFKELDLNRLILLRRRIFKVAQLCRLSPAQVALGWVLSKPWVSTAVFSARNCSQLKEIVQTPNFLAADIVDFLEGPEERGDVQKRETRATPVRSARIPPSTQTLEILLGYACAAKCPFCYNPPLTSQVLSQKISIAQAAARLYLARQEGFDGVWFTGGEVTQLENLPQYLSLAQKMGYQKIQIGTNGIRTAHRAYARRLAACGLNYARVSIHAVRAEVHDRILGINGSFERAALSLNTLREAGVAVGVNFVLNRLNVKELSEFLELASVGWEIEDVDILFPHIRGMMTLNEKDWGISYTEAAREIERALKRLKKNSNSQLSPHWINFPPCVLPIQSTGHIKDWKRTDGEKHTLFHPEGFLSELAEMKIAQKRQGASCASCRLTSECMGYEVEYAQRHGDAEFIPLQR